MAEEIEGLTESSEEAIHHGAHSGPHWASWVALATTFLAVLAAVAALLSGSNESEATLHQQQASDQWAYYQAKGIKAKDDANAQKLTVKIDQTNAQLDKVLALLSPKSAKKADDAVTAAPAESDASVLAENLARYKEEQEKISEKAKDLEKERDQELVRHNILAKAVTFFQVAIGISAISILMKKRRFFAVGLAFAAGGLIFLVLGLLKYLGH